MTPPLDTNMAFYPLYVQGVKLSFVSNRNVTIFLGFYFPVRTFTDEKHLSKTNEKLEIIGHIGANSKTTTISRLKVWT